MEFIQTKTEIWKLCLILTARLCNSIKESDGFCGRNWPTVHEIMLFSFLWGRRRIRFIKNVLKLKLLHLYFNNTHAGPLSVSAISANSLLAGVITQSGLTFFFVSMWSEMHLFSILIIVIVLFWEISPSVSCSLYVSPQRMISYPSILLSRQPSSSFIHDPPLRSSSFPPAWHLHL